MWHPICKVAVKYLQKSKSSDPVVFYIARSLNPAVRLSDAIRADTSVVKAHRKDTGHALKLN